MTITEALAASKTGIAIRHYSKHFMQAVTIDRHAFYYTPETMARTSWPSPPGDNWQILNEGPTQRRILEELANVDA